MTKLKSKFLILFLITGLVTYAWDPEEFGPEPPPDDVPIDNVFGVIAVVVLILFFVSKKMRTVQTKVNSCNSTTINH